MRLPDWQSEDGRNRMYCGDMLDILPDVDEKADTVITDPPYGLEFMGKDWDHGVPGAVFWQAVSVACKPGAMMLAFGGTRTYHRLTCGIEEGGWEIRDCMMWLYGSGFPKSLDISKAIDKAAGAKRKVIGNRPYTCDDIRGNSSNGRGISGAANDGKPRLEIPITAPATDAARLWNGWGTALKPAWEPIIVAMKPLDGTFAENAQRHGVAGVNVDGSRIAAIDFEPKDRVGAAKLMEDRPWQDEQKKNGRPRIVEGNSLGRWPANLIVDVKAAAMLDEQSGELKSGTLLPHHVISARENNCKGRESERVRIRDFGGDSGGASRFFYCAKASKSERGKNNNHPTVKPLALMEYLCKLTATPTGGIVLDPFMGSGTTGVACVKTGRRFIGIEKERKYFDIAVGRMEAAIREQQEQLIPA